MGVFNKTRSNILQHAILGVVIGLLFIVCIWIDDILTINYNLPFTLGSIAILHKQFPIYYVIDLLPLILGLMAAYIGYKLDKSRRHYQLLMIDKTRQLISNHDKLDIAQKISKIGTYEFDLANNEKHYSDEFFVLQDITSKEEKDLFYGDPDDVLTNYKYNNIHPDDRNTVATYLTQCFKAYADFGIEYRFLSIGGEIKYFILQGRFIREGGVPTKLYGVLQDISEMKIRELELIEAKKLAEQAGVAKASFLSNMSHEIRTPMNAVIGYTNLLMMGEVSPEHREYLQGLQYSANHLLSLINDILDFSKIEAGKVDLEYLQFGPATMLENIYKIFKLSAQEKQLDFKLSYPHGITKKYVLGDTIRLNQVLVNLVNNAIKFTEKGSIEIGYKIIAETKATIAFRFFVSDTGIGIDANKLPHIFDSFTQGSAAITRKYGGTGLGLAISKRLVELMGGTIVVQSEAGVGTTFSFDIKFQRAGDNELHKLSNASPQVEEADLHGMNILVVEDNAMNVKIVTRFLDKWNASYKVAVNGLEGVEMIQKDMFDVVLMDLQMPEMDGLTATRVIRALDGPRFKDLPVIALTASASVEVLEKIKAYGLNDYMTKPFNPNQLFLCLQNYRNSKTSHHAIV